MGGKTTLAGEIRALHAGRPDSSALLAALRAELLHCPLSEEGDEARLVTLHQEDSPASGLAWLPAFTSLDTLREYAEARGERNLLPYASIYGHRLLDSVLPALEVATGLALDLATDRPLLLPPTQEESAA